ncbi:MAG: PH domain-containing protein, partial [Actinobacteria bacterium]|nr:PH domain-containing protein [Actinomycetota bacterium]
MNAPGPGWHRLHPLSPVVGAGRAVVTVAVIFAPSVVGGGRDTWGSAGHLGVLGVLVLLGLVSWLVTRWRIEGDALQIETGLVRRRSLRYPLVQIQAIDTVRPGIARLFGLAELRLRMAGTGGAARLAYLPAGQADAVRAQLLAARRVEAPGHAPPAEYEEVLVRIPTARVAGSVVLSWPVIVMSIEVAVLAVSVIYNLTVLRTIAGSTAVFFIGAAATLWRGFNRSYRLTVADAHDGLRVSSGLVETTAETIPRGRVQAVQITRPVLWRPLGWCRLEVDIAGRVGGRGHGDERGARRQLRSVLPVGTLAEAHV